MTKVLRGGRRDARPVRRARGRLAPAPGAPPSTLWRGPARGLLPGQRTGPPSPPGACSPASRSGPRRAPGHLAPPGLPGQAADSPATSQSPAGRRRGRAGGGGSERGDCTAGWGLRVRRAPPTTRRPRPRRRARGRSRQCAAREAARRGHQPAPALGVRPGLRRRACCGPRAPTAQPRTHTLGRRRNWAGGGVSKTWPSSRPSPGLVLPLKPRDHPEAAGSAELESGSVIRRRSEVSLGTVWRTAWSAGLGSLPETVQSGRHRSWERWKGVRERGQSLLTCGTGKPTVGLRRGRGLPTSQAHSQTQAGSVRICHQLE